MVSIVAVADDKSFTSLLKESSYISSETTFITEFEGDIYLVSVGKSEIDGTASPQSKMNAIEEATLQAQKGIMQFIQGTQVTSIQQLENKSVTIKTIKNGEVISIDKERTKQFLTTVHEEGSGALKKVKKIGRWRDESAYYVALALKAQ